MYIISSETSARKSSSNKGCFEKWLCGTQLLQLVHCAHGPSLQGKRQREKNKQTFHLDQDQNSVMKKLTS